MRSCDVRRNAGFHLIWLGLLAGACDSATRGRQIPAPDADLITVFYPGADGNVRGRGLAGTFPSNSVSHVQVRALPTGTFELQSVDDDGGFGFSVFAPQGGDLLEISGSSDETGDVLGPPVYIQVPQSVNPFPEFVCCESTGNRRSTCVEESVAEAAVEANEDPCPDVSGQPEMLIRSCESAEDCLQYSGETLEIDASRIKTTAPNERGKILVEGFVEPNTQLRLENRGLNGIGIADSTSTFFVITDAAGGFRFENVSAKGDDEIVLQVQDLNGFRSPEVSIKVADAPLVGVDIVGAFAFRTLTPGSPGPISLLLSPWGIDGRGICPDDENSTAQICFSGGLSHEMISVERAEMQVAEGLQPLNMVPTSTSLIRGVEGDVRSGPQEVVLVLDHSVAAAEKDLPNASGIRFAAARQFIQGLRSRDRVGLVTFSGTPTRLASTDPSTDSGLKSLENRSELVAALDAIAQTEAGAGHDLFSAIQHAAEGLRLGRAKTGKIIAITAAAPEGSRVELIRRVEDLVRNHLQENISQGRPPITVDIIATGIALGTPNLDQYDDLATYAGGSVHQSTFSTSDGLEKHLADVRSYLSGNFILLYDITPPLSAGKSGIIELDLNVTINGAQVTSSYRGPLNIKGSTN